MAWRAIYKSALLALLAWLGSGIACADERILSFDETVTVNADGSMYVRETIRVRAEGDKIRRGIFRDFPTRYTGRGGHPYVVGFAFQAASRDGQSEQWHAEDRGNGVRIYLGSPDVYVPAGEHTYELVFRTDRQLGYFADHDELYWNVTGNGWDFPIDRVTARVELPQGIPSADVKLEGYTGPQGAKGQDYTAQMQAGTPLFAATRSLQPHEGLTIVLMWPKGFIMPPVESSQPAAGMPGGATNNMYDARRVGSSPAEFLLNRDLRGGSLPKLLALLGLALLVFYYYWIWARVGRDPPSRIAIPEYEMPKDQSAASMRYLLEMGYDNKCFAASVLALAVKGYLRIQEESGLLNMGKTYTLVKVKSSTTKPLSSEEQQLLASLFSGGDTLVLENENHSRVNHAQTAHEDALKARYSKGFFMINGGWHFLGIVLSLVLAAPAVLLPGKTDNWPQWHFTTPGGWFTLAVVIAMMVVNGVFGSLLKAPTVVGQAIMNHIRGFKMYLEVAEGEDLKRMKAPPPLTPQLFESYLPAALALGVEQKWSERFARVLDMQSPDYAPTWYVGQGWNISNMGAFSRDLGSSLGSAISSASQAPGSSSGGGGGGSSGGGGGGGGGGGW